MSSRRYRTWAHRLLASLLTILVFAAIAPSAAYSETRTVRVGQLRNPPLVFTDESGRPAGLFVDILQHVAAEQGWKLEWIPCIWSACLSRLVEGEIDLISGIAYSEERARNFDFTLETVFNNWAVVLRASGSEIHSITDLEGLRVATPPRSIHSRALRHILESFNIRSEVMEIGTTDMVRALQTGEVSAGIVNRLRALKLARRSGIEKTAIIFNPVELRFATAKGNNADLRAPIDHAMSALKSDNSSAYYASLDKWLFAEDPQIAVSAWVWWVLSITGGVLLMLFAFNQMLQARVKLSTASLRSAQAALLRKERLAALGQLTGTVAHEIRNPLGVIANSFRVIKHKCSEADLDMETTLERADRGIKRCDRIVTELLDFARARGLQPEPTAINTWLSDILDEHHVPEGSRSDRTLKPMASPSILIRKSFVAPS